MRCIRALFRTPPPPVRYPQSDVVTGGDLEDEPTTFRLRSREGLYFTVRVVVFFRAKPGAVDPDPLSLAATAVRRRAEAVCTDFSLLDHDRLWAELDAQLGALKLTDNPSVAACARHVDVAVDERELEAVAEYEHSRALARLGDWQWKQRLARADQIVDLLADPRRATGWWLAADTSDGLQDVRPVAEVFVEVARILGFEQDTGNEVVTAIARLWDELDLVSRNGMVDILDKYARQHDREDLSRALRRLTV